jgi:hypothetical protein
VSYGLPRASEYEDEILLLKARAYKAEAERDEFKKLSSHGNGEILLGWMDAHKKAMDRLEEAEAENKMLRDAIEKHQRETTKDYSMGPYFLDDELYAVLGMNQ